jgi:peptidoglycan/LPS O-acetylase OafA/YrhL
MQTAPHIASDPAAPAPPRHSFSATQASVLLDLVRGLAALLVVLQHSRNLFFVDYSDLPAHRALFTLPYLLASLAHESVIVFFVLSGYLISGSVFRMFQAHAWSWRTYLLHRCVRLWIVLLPGLALAALCDWIGLHLHRPTAVALYAGNSGDHLVPAVAQTFHLSTWLGNLFFLQQTFVPVFGSDGPLWSLANEFWYYLLFPLGLLALRRHTALAARILCIVLFAAIAFTLNKAILLLFPVWLCGTLLARLPAPRLSLPWRIAAAVVYAPLVIFFAKFFSDKPQFWHVASDEIFGLVTLGFLYVLLSARAPANERSFSTRVFRTLARFSYTLYVVHLPFLILIAALVLPATRWTPDPAHIALWASIVALALAYAWTLASFTEFRTDKLRKAIERRLPR